MNFRKFAADRIFDGFQFLSTDTIIITDTEGTIIDLVNTQDAGEGIEHHQGILLPGLINSHCHLELSHMKGMIPERTGLVDFLIQVVSKRGKDEEAIVLEKIAQAEQEMYTNGIDAVADISNTIHSIETKKSSKLHWYNLIEVLNFFDATLPRRLSYNQQILSQFNQLSYSNSLTPHAPYTVSASTFLAINRDTKGKIISIHNQETAAENELFEKGSGAFLRLYEATGVGKSPFPITGLSSLQTYLPYFTNEQKIILVHNTFTNENDIHFAQEYAKKNNLTIAYCLCPNANLYIENSLPPLDLLLQQNGTILLGTDSYSSNWQLSIAKEIQVLQHHFPNLSLEIILKWATSNGAKFFGWQHLGELKKNAKPGLALLEIGKDKQLTGFSRRII